MTSLPQLEEHLTRVCERAELKLVAQAMAGIGQAAKDGMLEHGRLAMTLVIGAAPQLDELTSEVWNGIEAVQRSAPDDVTAALGVANTFLSGVYSRLPSTLMLDKTATRGDDQGTRDEIARLNLWALGRIRDHAAGFGARPEHKSGHSVNMFNSTGVILQGDNNVQVASVVVDWRAVREIVNKIEGVCAHADLSPDLSNAVQADLDSIKAQLRKPTPGAGVVRAAANSLVAISQGALGGALLTAPHLNDLLQTLWRLVGAG